MEGERKIKGRERKRECVRKVEGGRDKGRKRQSKKEREGGGQRQAEREREGVE